MPATARIRDFLYDLARLDRRCAVLCACRIAREQSKSDPRRSDEIWRAAITTAEGWARGEATEQECWRAAEACKLTRLGVLAAFAAYVASGDDRHIESLLHEIPSDSHGALCALLERERWPPTTPTPAQIQRAPSAVQVAWDAVASREPVLTIGQLAALEKRADRLGLDWEEPVQRAIAERADDEGRIRGLLGSGASRQV